MSLWCGNCREQIFNGFGILYRALRLEGVLQLPNKDAPLYQPANSAVCHTCWRNVPDAEKRTGNAVQLELEAGMDSFVYVYTPADSSRCLVGSKSWSDIQTNNTKLTFLQKETVTDRLRLAIDIIDGMEEGARLSGEIAHQAFYVRFIRYLDTCSFKIRGMRLFAYGMIGIHDDSFNQYGDFDVYFDPSSWKATDPKIWGESLTPSFLQKEGLGLLRGDSTAPRPKDFSDLLRFATRTLIRFDGKSGQIRDPIEISVPYNLQPKG